MPCEANDKSPESGLPTRSQPPRESAAEASGVSVGVSDPKGFLPGTLLAGRYRIVGLVGRGGMGEVYRADDLKLGQAVALKFLPPGLERDKDRLNRFLNEVRLALRVSHPNVCRVHDIGDVDGRPYFSMEFVDGENLASLLRRIGRLPQDKAIEVSRQLCAGLSAAHEQGVLHRDLKPANVMIDGRGHVKIADFGLAGVQAGPEGVTDGAGTPAYMAPEQWAGQAATAQSDIYALGLVLHELFTGKPVFSGRTAVELAELHQRAIPAKPSSHIEGLDPDVEQVILRCLEKDPKDRPTSAWTVARALPGGDLLAAALAAGTTPPPEMVAQAGASRGLRPSTAWACLLAALICSALVVWLAGTRQLVRVTNLDKHPEVLMEKAREIILALGYNDSPADHLFGFHPNADYIAALKNGESDAGKFDVLRNHQPAALAFWYRQSPRPLVKSSPGTIGNEYNDPPITSPGMIRIRLDPEGRLLSFLAVPPALDESKPSPTEPLWTPLVELSGLEPGDLREVDPAWIPPVYADRRAAWEGVYPDSPATPIRLEAAACQGRIVSFEIVEPWTRPSGGTASKWSSWASPADLLRHPLLFPVLIAGVLVARRNVRLGRGDRKAALRFAVYIGCVRLLWWLGDHHSGSGSELNVFMTHLAWALSRAGLVWVFYLAIEPYARRFWPRILITWVRLLHGQWKDPLVGRDLLVGALVGVAVSAFVHFSRSLPDWLGWTPFVPEISPPSLEALRGARHALTALFVLHSENVIGTLGNIMLLVVYRVLFRHTWLAIALVAVVGTIVVRPDSGSLYVYVASMAVALAVVWTLLFRCGLLSVLVAMTVTDLLGLMPLTFESSSWYVGATALTLGLILGITLYAFFVSLGGRPLFKDDIAPAETSGRG